MDTRRRVRVIGAITLCRGPQDPHFLQAKPSYMRVPRDADLILYNGLPLEIGWLPLLKRAAAIRG